MTIYKAPVFIAVLTAMLGSVAWAQDAAPAPPLPEAADVIDDAVLEGDSCCEIDACCGDSCAKAGCGCGGGGLGLTVGGWLSAGWYGNAHGADLNGPLGFNDVGDGFTLNQLWVFAEKAVDTGGYGVDWGFRMDFVYGVDGPDTQAFGGLGWDTEWSSGRDYGAALPQFYGEIGINDLTIKLGHFYTLIGWEVVPAPDNFFYSHAYTMYYAEPFTHTGVLASYAVNDDVTVHGGWTQGWDTGFDNTFEQNMFLGGISLPIGESISAAWMITAGDFGIDAGDLYMQSLVFECLLTERLTYIFQTDLGVNTGAVAGDAEWYGINQYLQYEINDTWAAGLRFEWFRDDDGARVVVDDATGIGNAGNYWGLTAGLNWRPYSNFVVRPEVRWDWYDGLPGPAGAPFDNATEEDQFSAGFDFIFTF